ncbi:hypothetical protein CEXT_588291 [Caerostris extrusa]|uniref:Uncharacterized protein n=1 Tax=Caerostris extrusa TaxID=172846 RepID=A0AAV4Q5U3_CAEEX|nr:hypothetical protein CEXT_588291 [Caerostris extrusa]
MGNIRKATRVHATPSIYQTSIHLGNTVSVETRSCIFNTDGRNISRRFSSAPELFPVPEARGKNTRRNKANIRALFLLRPDHHRKREGMK